MKPANPSPTRLGQAPRLAAQGLITAYRYSLSAFTGGECRHLPTCSDYADEAIGRFGLWAGGWMTLARICRCHPYGTAGLDFVPRDCAPRTHWYLPWRYGRWRGTHAAMPPDESETPTSAAAKSPDRGFVRGEHPS